MVLHFRKGTGVFVKTFPWVIVRFAISLAFALVGAAYFAVIAFVLFVVTGVSGGIAILALAAAGIIFYGFFRLLRGYLLYLVTAGHVAVIAHTVTTGNVPSNQLRFGKRQVRDRFTEASVLFGIDRVLRGVITQFNNTITSMGNQFGFVPGLKQLVAVLNRAVGIAASYIDEAIIAHMFVHDSKGNWTAARDGVVLYAKTWKPVLASTLIIVLASYAALFVLLISFVPIAGVLGGIAPALEIGGWILVGAFVLVSYFGLFNPWVKTIVITTYLVESANETPDSETMDYIASKSAKFRTLRENAAAEAHGEPLDDGDDFIDGTTPV